MKTKNKIIFFFIISFLTLTTGCKTKKITTTSNTSVNANKTEREIIEDALNSEVAYNTLQAKGQIEFKIGDGGQKAPAVFKLVKDRVIQASVRIPFLGSEAMRMTITPDSIVIVDRLKKNYMAEPFKDSKVISGLDFNFYNLQSLFTNKIFLPGKQDIKELDMEEFKVSSGADVFVLQAKGKDDILYNFAIDASNHVASTLIYNEKKNITLQWVYSDFMEDAGRLYPTNMLAKIDVMKKRLDIGISYSKVEIDADITVDNSIPSKYDKVTFSELINSYAKIK